MSKMNALRINNIFIKKNCQTRNIYNDIQLIGIQFIHDIFNPIDV